MSNFADVLNVKEMKTLYISSSKNISFNNDNLYINGEIQESSSVSEVSILAKNEMMRTVNMEMSRLLSHFPNIAVLTAAGTSMDNGSNSGKTRDGLWNYCSEEIEKVILFLKNNNGFNGIIEAEYKAKNIEQFLSLLLLYEKVNKKIVDTNQNCLIEAIEKKIAEACNLVLDPNNKHHGDLITKLSARKPSQPRLQLYTTNYDTLFEQAANKRGFVIIDGFSFSHPRLFSGINFDYDIVYRDKTRIKNEESFIPNVFQLFKIHGSIDWEKRNDEKIYQSENIDNPCIIYPASDKYESSYEQPYFEMMSHFQQTLRKDGTLLIVIGFGFADKHIQNIIKEAVYQNTNFHLLIVCYGCDDGIETGITNKLVPDFLNGDLSLTSSNISIVFSKFKDFVELIPLNYSYLNFIDDETI